MLKRRIKTTVDESSGETVYLKQKGLFGIYKTVDHCFTEPNALRFLMAGKIKPKYIYPPIEVTANTVEGPM